MKQEVSILHRYFKINCSLQHIHSFLSIYILIPLYCLSVVCLLSVCLCVCIKRRCKVAFDVTPSNGKGLFTLL